MLDVQCFLGLMFYQIPSGSRLRQFPRVFVRLVLLDAEALCCIVEKQDMVITLEENGSVHHPESKQFLRNPIHPRLDLGEMVFIIK